MPGVRTAPLEDWAVRELVARVVDTDVPEPMGAYVFGPYEAGAELARHVELAVLLEAFGNTAELLDEQYRAYDATSVFFCVIDHRRRLPVGMMRLVVPYPGGPGLKSLNDVEAVWGTPATVLMARSGGPDPRAATWDVATLAVMPEYRGAAAAGLVSLALYQSVLACTQRLGIDWIVAIVDMTVYRMSRVKFREPFVAYGPARSYLGSPGSVPVFLSLAEWNERLALTDRSIHDVLFSGVGIAAAVRPLDLDAAIRRVPRDDRRPRGRPQARPPSWAERALRRSTGYRRQATALPPGASAGAGRTNASSIERRDSNRTTSTS